MVYRAAVIAIDRRRLSKLLDLPEDVTVESVHFDVCTDLLLLRAEGPMLPLVHDGHQLQRIRPTYADVSLEDGHKLCRLVDLGAPLTS